MDSSLISPDDTWILWMFITVWAATSIYLEQRFTWASKISGAIIALIGAVILSNLHIIPTESPVYDIVWDYVVPLSIPLLLFQADIGEIRSEEHTSELQSRFDIVCRLLLEKKKILN